MRTVFVAKSADFDDGARRIVESGSLEIGVFRRNGALYAYSNLCPHQGGPACEGLVIHKVEDVIAPDRTHQGQRFSETELHIVCPWHGWEYDLETGSCVADRRYRLKKYDVVERDGEIHVVV
ncbi:MAG: Rieske (2Fe-2S) protein [Chloroflexi bacterium]|nr:Rieske (2Fe-2S) protein [Chloroflexota bacterium]